MIFYDAIDDFTASSFRRAGCLAECAEVWTLFAQWFCDAIDGLRFRLTRSRHFVCEGLDPWSNLRVMVVFVG
jgi:hypothetical protein